MKLIVTIKDKEFAEAVIRSNMTYRAIAKKLGISSVYLSNIKNKCEPEFRPSPAVRKGLLTILNVQFDDIFKIEDSNGKVPKKKKRKKAKV